MYHKQPGALFSLLKCSWRSIDLLRHFILKWDAATRHLQIFINIVTCIAEKQRVFFPGSPWRPPFFIAWSTSSTILYGGVKIIIQKEFHPFFQWWQRLSGVLREENSRTSGQKCIQIFTSGQRRKETLLGFLVPAYLKKYAASQIKPPICELD